MFIHYVRTNDFARSKSYIELQSLEGVDFNQDDNSVLLRIKYEDPSDFGLLIRKNDTLIFDRVLDFDYVSLFQDNSTAFLMDF